MDVKIETRLFTTGTLIVAALVTYSLTYYMQRTVKRQKMTSKGHQLQKQGAYGKVKVFKESLWTQLFQPTEVYAMFRCKAKQSSWQKSGKLSKGLKLNNTEESCVDYCEEKLSQVSRSFALVITFLPNTCESPLRLGVAVFYLVLRALDTVEDEMTLEKFDAYREESDKKAGCRQAIKERLLRNFYKRLSNKSQEKQLLGIGLGDELDLVENFEKVVHAYSLLPESMQAVISDITIEMGSGMADYVARDLRQGTDDAADFSRYCHIVAGTVGDGLSRLFVASGLESIALVQNIVLWDSMGEFLQRTNIIRDYKEDFEDGRAFWPRSVWEQYVQEKEGLGALSLDTYIIDSTSQQCLNHMIADALSLVPKVLAYLDLLRNPEILSFCALPQVMAISTLHSCYDNANVFRGVVKIRKGTSALIILSFAPDGSNERLESLRQTYKAWFKLYVTKFREDAIKTLRKYNDDASARVLQIANDVLRNL